MDTGDVPWDLEKSSGISLNSESSKGGDFTEEKYFSVSDFNMISLLFFD